MTIETIKNQMAEAVQRNRQTTKERIIEQVLKAQDSSVSKRDLLGLNKNKARKANQMPLFEEKGLF